MAGGRKRVVKKDTAVEVQEEEEEPVVKKGRGGGRQKTAKAAGGKKKEEQIDVKQEEEEMEEEEATTITDKEKNGAEATKLEEGEEEELKDEDPEVEEEEKTTPVVNEPENKKPKRGRKPVVKAEDEETEAPVTAKRGRRAVQKKKVVQEESEPEDEEMEAPVTAKRGRRAAQKKKVVQEESEPEDEETEAPVTAKRGRRAAQKKKVVQEESESEDEETEAPVTAKKRGRAAPKKKVVQEEAAIKKDRRGRKAAVKTEETVTAPSQKGRRGKRAAATVKQDVTDDDDDDDEEEEEAPASSKGKRGRGKASKVKKQVDVKTDETAASDGTQEEEEAASTAKASGGRNAKPKVARGKKGATKAVTPEEKENTDTTNLPSKSGQKTGVVRVVVAKGRAAVDAICPIAQHSHVYEDGDDIWDCMLNQTNIQYNNNKYYLIQLLEDDSSKSYSVWMRWGRVGANGQNSLQPCGSNLEKAMKIFTKNDKTKNEWECRFMFEKVPGKYDLLKMDYSKGKDTPDTSAAIKKPKEKAAVESVLHPSVRAIIELICDVRRMEEAVVEMKYDAKKAPLGKLTTDQIKAGYMALKRIDDLIQAGKHTAMDLVQACNDFYTRVPHYFGMKVPPLIRTNAEVREKVSLLEALGDIQAALSVLDKPIDVNTHPADQHYNSLKCDMTHLAKDSEEYRIIEMYMNTTHAKTHNQYKLQLLEVLQCNKESEHQRFKDVGNKMLLWHGSRMSNWAGILSQGLRIAPPEAPVTGYMFGKGLYFADMASKSANYCWANARSNVGFLLLSEVALGKSNELLHADCSANKLPQGCHSVKGCGRTAPQPQNFTKLPDGTVVPMGPGAQGAGKTSTNLSLLYNEYIVYDPAQVLTRFLLKVQFNFK